MIPGFARGRDRCTAFVYKQPSSGKTIYRV